MGYKLRREVRDALPPGVLTAGERLLVLELADICGDDTREGWPGITRLAELTDMSARSIQQTLSRIAKSWIELRVPLGKNANGKVYYAYAGKRTIYRFPPLPAREGAMDECPSGATDEYPLSGSGATDRSEWCDGSVEVVRQMSDPSPQGTSSQINHSSLSPREDAGPVEPEPTNEREMDEASPTPEPTNPIHQLIAKHGAPDEKVSFVEGWIDSGNNVQGPGFYFTADRNGSLALLVGDALAAYAQDPYASTGSTCATCDDTGEAGDWMNRRPCDCLWWRDPATARREFVPQLKDFEDCEHGWAGGDVRAPNGWQHCPECRGPGWVDKDVQPRTDKTTNTRRYEPWRPPSHESAYDRLFPGEIRSPADQRVVDGQALYEKYERRRLAEEAASTRKEIR